MTEKTKPWSEIKQEISEMLDNWHAEPFTKEEIERIGNEIQHRVCHRPHLKDYQKEAEENEQNTDNQQKE